MARSKGYSDKYFNREVSWIKFNERVLGEITELSTPLLEKVKFLSIFSSNFDEFFMVRLAGLKKLLGEQLEFFDSPDQSKNEQIFSECIIESKKNFDLQYDLLSKNIIPDLKNEGIDIKKTEDLTKEEKKRVSQIFHDEIFPVLTPRAIDPSHPFPFLINLSVYLVATFQPTFSQSPESATEPELALLELPQSIPRLININDNNEEFSGDYTYVWLEDIIKDHLPDLFFGLKPIATYQIRVTRNLDYYLLENEVVDILKSIRNEVVSREYQEVVRLEVSSDLPQDIITYLQKQLELKDNEVFRLNGPLDLRGMMKIYEANRPDLKYAPFNPRIPVAFSKNQGIFSIIRDEDQHHHHPYHSFYAVMEFLNAAAIDPNVLAIKQTLYRTGGDSPVIQALIRAAQNGKKVTAMVELKARFDERNNLAWAKKLEEAGVNVVYGFVGLKTHAKCTLVVRSEGKNIKRYAHLSTGNYNASTAKLYTDFGLLTYDQMICEDISTLFNLLTGFNIFNQYMSDNGVNYPIRMNKLAIAPINLRDRFLDLINEQIKRQKSTKDAEIIIKVNALIDKKLIDKLYEASKAGVTVKVICRGVCCLRPGIKGMSENIMVTSVIGRFLEHSRVYQFGPREHRKTYLSSADFMPRNMDRRVEVLFPIENESHKERISETLNIYLYDKAKAHILKKDGKYQRVSGSNKNNKLTDSSQNSFIDLARAEGLKSLPYDKAVRHKLKGKKAKNRPTVKSAKGK